MKRVVNGREVELSVVESSLPVTLWEKMPEGNISKGSMIKTAVSAAEAEKEKINERLLKEVNEEVSKHLQIGQESLERSERTGALTEVLNVFG